MRGDIAHPEHWEKVWKETPNVHGFSRFNYYDYRLARLFTSIAAAGARVLEIGCGGSRWLAFHDRVLRCEVWGIDYSPEGFRLAAESNPGPLAAGHLVQADFFDSTSLPLAYFDVIYSLGFIEHFSDPTEVTRRCAELLRADGVVMTLVPNFTSLYGRLQKAADAEIFAKHVVMAPGDLDRYHQAAGLVPEMPAQYWGCFAPGVVNFGRWEKLVRTPIKLLQQAICWPLHAIRCDGESAAFSPYVVGVYRVRDRR
jgi:2-polyprenyl-3-methyl-5-hydroxy-6-metoxy-1,4-benzoquinol methylase